MLLFGFDVISDLNLNPSDDFDWTGKPTSLFCLIPGNISDDMTTVTKVLKHLSNLYQGVFFIDGSLENSDIQMRDNRISELQAICSGLRNVIYLHNNVVVIDGIALVGINGWYKNYNSNPIIDDFNAKCLRLEDISYLEKTLERLQLHVDVKKIIIISNCVPFKELYYGECDNDEEIYPGYVLYRDTEHKVVKWVYGSHTKQVDTTINNVNYMNNTKYDREPYYAKRIEVSI